MRVRIAYRDSNLDIVDTRDYDIDDYTALLATSIRGAIGDVESALYDVTQREKSEWDENTIRCFNRIKHKLLDSAGEVERLSRNMYDEGRLMEADEAGFIAKVFGKDE